MNATTTKAMMVAFAGSVLSDEQVAFFKDINPFGYALFLRKDLGNIQDPEQVKRLTDQLRDISGRADVPIAIDQEGGRVQRFREPHWPELPAAKIIGDLYRKNPEVGLAAVRLHTRTIAASLRAAGINTVFAPVADLVTDNTHNAIGDRGFSTDKDAVITLVTTVLDEFIKGGVIPTLKHIPGYGQVDIDPHLALPEIHASNAFLQDNDFYVFREIIKKVPVSNFYGMNAHVKYAALDPQNVSTFSRIIMHDVTRGAMIGFQGLMFADAIEMNALGGTMAERCQKFWAAGGDIALHCTGKPDEIQAIADIAPYTTEDQLLKQQQAERARVDGFVYTDDDAHDLAQQLLNLLHMHDVQWAINKISPSN